MNSETPLTQNPDALAIAALHQRLRRPPVSFLYAVGMALVAIAMLVLPLVYLAVVGAVGFAVYWHATRSFWWQSPSGGVRIGILTMLIYLALLVAGLIIVFFLLKPLLARRGRRAQPLALHPGAEQRLYAFIEAVSHAVGAPAPRRIDLSCELNASAGFRRGLLSFLGNDLVLTLGLPLVANLTVGELAGVVAHEFGHFNQGISMRLHHVVTRINQWFARVVYQRDSWDEALQDAGDNPEDWRVGLIVWTAQLGVGVSRLLLEALMHIGIALSAFLSRQMEFHADACEYAVAGSETSERTTRKFATLAVAMEQAGKSLRDGWRRSHRLPDNLPELLRTVHDGLSADVRARTDSSLGLERTAWYHTHPCPAERIQRARQAHAPGILLDDRPARALFERFDIPARQVTELYYTDDLGIPIDPESLFPLNATTPNAAVQTPPPGTRSYRELTAAPLNESLLLGAPELLLPLPWDDTWIGNALDDTPTRDDEPGELVTLIRQLESVRPQIADWALQARRTRPLAAGGDTAPATPTPTAVADELQREFEALRRPVREVIEGTARRLHLGLQRAWRDGPPPGANGLITCQAWLRDAYSEFDRWWALYHRTALIGTRAHPVSACEDSGRALDPSLESELIELRLLRSALTTQPADAISGTALRRLRVGPQAEMLRELDALHREAVAWFETYHNYLSRLWEIAGCEETRVLSFANSGIVE